MNIIIVDDDNFVSLSLKTILEAQPNIHVIAIGKNGIDAIQLYKTYLPDILLMAIRMDIMDGLEATEKILDAYPQAKILLLTTFSDDEYIIKAIQLGAKGYILKQAFETIAPALISVYNGQTVFGNEIMDKIPSLIHKQPISSYENFMLTDKEFELICLVADGLNNKEIASKLFLSEGTVRNYISTILEKLNLRDRIQLACFYYKSLISHSE